MSLRVALVTPEYPGCGPSYGIGAYIRTLAMALGAAGSEVLILVCDDVGCWSVDPGCQPQRLASGSLPFAVRPLVRRHLIQCHLRAWRPDVVEASNWGGLGAVAVGPWRLVARLSTPTRVIRQITPWRRLLKPVHHAWEVASVRRADVVIADSVAMAALGERVYGRGSDAIIAHGWGGGIGPLVGPGNQVLFVGRMERRKGIDVLLAAWRLVRRLQPDAMLHLVGEDPEGFGAACQRTFGSDGVVIHGRLADELLDALRRRCPIQVVASRFESFGMVVLEAWAGGQAVVASNAGALPEVVGTGGRVVATGDPVGLATALASLLANPAETTRLARLGQERLRTAFSSADYARLSLSAYRAGRAHADDRSGLGRSAIGTILGRHASG